MPAPADVVCAADGSLVSEAPVAALARDILEASVSQMVAMPTPAQRPQTENEMMKK